MVNKPHIIVHSKLLVINFNKLLISTVNKPLYWGFRLFPFFQYDKCWNILYAYLIISSRIHLEMELIGQKAINNSQSQDINQHMINSAPTPTPNPNVRFFKIKKYSHAKDKTGIFYGPSL